PIAIEEYSENSEARRLFDRSRGHNVTVIGLLHVLIVSIIQYNKISDCWRTQAAAKAVSRLRRLRSNGGSIPPDALADRARCRGRAARWRGAQQRGRRRGGRAALGRLRRDAASGEEA